MSDRVTSLDQALKTLEERGVDPESAGGAVALGYLLAGSPTPAAPAPDVSPPAAPGTSVAANMDANRDDPAAVLAQWSGVTSNDILDIFELGDGSLGIGLSSGRLPDSKADCQRALVVLKLAAERIAGNHDVVPASEINELADHYGVLDQNLASNVATKTNMVARRGKRGSWNYRITQPGLDRAKAMIAALAAGEDL